MSGGSMDYLYQKVQDAEFRENTRARQHFRQHLKKDAEALHAIEWNDSGDGDDTEHVKIEDALGREVNEILPTLL